MWRRTPQRGLWFVGGGFNNCRQYSRCMALQIKGSEEGLLTEAQVCAGVNQFVAGVYDWNLTKQNLTESNTDVFSGTSSAAV